jgi:transmembrane sensor
MSTLLRFKAPRRTDEEAAGWLVSIEEGLSAAESTELARWLEADSAHGQALVRVARAWDSFDALGELAEIFPLEQYGHPTRTAWSSLRTAAVVLVSIGVAALGTYWLVGGERGAAREEPASFPSLEARNGGTETPADGTDAVSRSYETAVGEQLSTRLPDGSVITLNTATLLDIEYSAVERLVVLTRGEAIFRVAHEQARPFRVRAGERIVQAVGTVFNVKLTDDLEVTVTEGRVTVGHRAAPQVAPAAVSAPLPLTLDAGSLAVIRGSGDEVRAIEPEQIEANLAWQHGMLMYRGETLAAVLADMSRYTTARFKIADESLRDRRVGGYFRAGDVDGLLLALHESFDIEQRRDGDTIVLTDGR